VSDLLTLKGAETGPDGRSKIAFFGRTLRSWSLERDVDNFTTAIVFGLNRLSLGAKEFGTVVMW
jgi:hypothetical protein